MSTGYLAPLAPMVIPDSQYINFIFNIFIVLMYCWAREQEQIKIVQLLLLWSVRY